MAISNVAVVSLSILELPQAGSADGPPAAESRAEFPMTQRVPSYSRFVSADEMPAAALPSKSLESWSLGC